MPKLVPRYLFLFVYPAFFLHMPRQDACGRSPPCVGSIFAEISYHTYFAPTLSVTLCIIAQGQVTVKVRSLSFHTIYNSMTCDTASYLNAFLSCSLPSPPPLASGLAASDRPFPRVHSVREGGDTPSLGVGRTLPPLFPNWRDRSGHSRPSSPPTAISSREKPRFPWLVFRKHGRKHQGHVRHASVGDVPHIVHARNLLSLACSSSHNREQ